jgi:hypothetical protein
MEHTKLAPKGIIFRLILVSSIVFGCYSCDNKDNNQTVQNNYYYEIKVFNDKLPTEIYIADDFETYNHGSLLYFESNGLKYYTNQKFLITKKRK